MRTNFSISDTITINGFTYSADMATVLSVDKGTSSLNEMQRGVRYIGEGAIEKAEREFEIYREREMRLLESDFDKVMKRLKNLGNDTEDGGM